jgi:hypothetical protein
VEAGQRHRRATCGRDRRAINHPTPSFKREITKT